MPLCACTNIHLACSTLATLSNFGQPCPPLGNPAKCFIPVWLPRAFCVATRFPKALVCPLTTCQGQLVRGVNSHCVCVCVCAVSVHEGLCWVGHLTALPHMCMELYTSPTPLLPLRTPLPAPLCQPEITGLWCVYIGTQTSYTHILSS